MEKQKIMNYLSGGFSIDPDQPQEIAPMIELLSEMTNSGATHIKLRGGSECYDISLTPCAEREETDAEFEARKTTVAAQAKRNEDYERAMYEKLKTKFEPTK